MANTKQAKKRAVQSEKRRARNRSVVTRVRNLVKNLRKTAEVDASKVGGMLPGAIAELDVAARKGVLHRKTASRLKSRISRTANKAKKAAATS
ncbi:MAG TPA: 30S ribosomal protein S20 [Thermoanaerobaculia bacterium]|nr:30S ribosomal protein S20 [Thermoanaerobaculia bacterium]